MMTLRKLKLRLFPDGRIKKLTKYSKETLGRTVIYDEQYLKDLAKVFAKRTKIAYILGACHLKRGEVIVVSPNIEPEEKVYVLIHEIGHALDFEDPARSEGWMAAWRDSKSLFSANYLVQAEDRAFELGKKLADRLGVRVNEKSWAEYVKKKHEQNLESYFPSFFAV